MEPGEILDSRETAALIWLGVVVLCVLWSKKLRPGVRGVLKAFVQPVILVSLSLMVGWVAAEIWLGAKLSIWHVGLLKPTILWIFGSAVVLFFGLWTNEGSERFFRDTVFGLVAVTVFLEFFTNLFVLSLPMELLLQPTLAILALLGAAGMMNKDTQVVSRAANCVLAVVGFGLLTFALYRAYVDWRVLDKSEIVMEFALPVWLTVGLLPFMYCFSLYGAYDSAFRAINWAANSGKARWRARLALITKFHVRAQELRRFPWIEARLLTEAGSARAARDVISNYRKERREKEEAKAKDRERLRRYAGSKGIDNEGRRLDRREFNETMSALRWVATCQRGWYTGRGGRYRQRIERMVNAGMPVTGLPDEPEIQVRVSDNGQAWYAWRRTVTGWCFAIGGTGPPDLEWEYDGPEPPAGFPGEDPAWGREPLDEAARPNWG